MSFFNIRSSKSSREIAKERLKLMLVQDRIQVSPGLMEEIKEAFLTSLGKYLEMDREKAELSLQIGEKHTQLVATVPIKGVKRKLNDD
ncbi:MAG: cell division topological specificity factor MinE [Anaerolineae bacterium]|nr:cell division topological specificity factor MinE [Anaerolineae bacterium]MDW8101597.1 cell division topological specificity factor MinE [Anaerolineae bacterium]